MYARVAQFESDAGSLDQMVTGIRENLDRGREAMSPADARRWRASRAFAA